MEDKHESKGEALWVIPTCKVAFWLIFGLIVLDGLLAIMSGTVSPMTFVRSAVWIFGGYKLMTSARSNPVEWKGILAIILVLLPVVYVAFYLLGGRI